MDVKEAVAAAKQYATELFEAEGMFNLGLEEVEYDEAREQWLITLGFSRDWNQQSVLAAAMGSAGMRGPTSLSPSTRTEGPYR